MKFNVEIDLDWVEEDTTIDEEIKRQIIRKVEGNVTENLKKEITESAKAQIEKTVLETAVSAVNARVAELMQEKRVVTDKNGRVVDDSFSLDNKLIEIIDSALTKKTLNADGSTTNSYNAKYSMFEFMATKNIEKMVDERVALHAAKVSKDIESLVTEKIKTQVADKLTALIVDNSTVLSLKT